MHVRLLTLTALLIACATPALAATSNVDVYGTIDSLPTHETYSAAADIVDYFVSDPSYTPLQDVTASPGVIAQISGTTYSASASTTLGSNHAYVQSSSFPSGPLGAASFSGWYDQVTITGGTETGTAQFTVQLSGMADVGAITGGVGYILGTSSIHPSQLVGSLQYFNTLSSPQPWAMDAVTPIATYLLGASPYNDTSILFPDPSTLSTTGGIPAVTDPSLSLGGGMGFPTYDLVLTPGAGQAINVTLHGTLNFTYGEAFYLIGGLGTSLINNLAFCTFDGTCAPPSTDGVGATTLDFSNSANLVNIVLPEGTTASFASGTTYNVTTVPEPGEWLMLLAGLGLVGWHARRRA